MDSSKAPRLSQRRERRHLYGVVFVASIGLGTYTFFVPVFAQTLGATFLDLGYIGSATALAYAATPMLAGFLADKFNRTLLFTLTLVFNAMAALALVLSNSVWDVVFLRSIAGIGLGFFWPVADVLVADLATENRRVAEMGWYSVAWGSGYLIGPFVGGVLVQRYGYLQLFVFSAVIMLIALLPNFLWIVPSHKHTPVTYEIYLGTASTIRSLLPWYLMLLCYAVVCGVIMMIMPGYAHSAGVPPELIGLLFTVYGIARVSVFALSNWYSRFREKITLGATSGLVSLASLIVVFHPTLEEFFLAIGMMGVAIGVISPSTIGLISRHFPNKRSGAAMGSYEATFGIGFALGPILGGLIATLVNISAIFILTALMGVLMLFFTILGRTYVSPNTVSRLAKSTL